MELFEVKDIITKDLKNYIKKADIHEYDKISIPKFIGKTNSAKIDIDSEYDTKHKTFYIHLDLDYDEEEYCGFFPFYYEFKKTEIKEFINNIKDNKIAFLNTASKEIGYYDYLHIMIVAPYEEYVRYMLIDVDYIAQSDEKIKQDILIKKEDFINMFEKAIEEIETKLKQ